MIASFETVAAYGQIALFTKNGNAVFPYWTEAHIQQGFAMTTSVVSFGFPDHEGTIWIEISLEDSLDYVPETAIRCIEVPFSVQEEGVGLSTFDGEIDIPVPSGDYTIRFTLLPGRPVDENWATHVVMIQIAPRTTSNARILHRDDEITAINLIETADPLPA